MYINGENDELYCDACGKKIPISVDYFSIQLDYINNENKFTDNELALMNELKNMDDIGSYLSHSFYGVCKQCQEKGFIADFLTKLRDSRVKLIRKLAKEDKIPELLIDKIQKKEDLKIYENAFKDAITKLKNLDPNADDYTIFEIAHDLLEAEERRSVIKGILGV